MMASEGIKAHSQGDESSDEFELIETKEAALDDGAIAKIKEWLQPTDYDAESSEYHRHLLSRAPGTGLWICETDNYRKWYTSTEHGSLWIKGVPGAGKSVTAAAIAKTLKEAEDAPVLTFFFRYIVLANRKPRNLIRDWLAQLLPASVRLQHSLQFASSRELDDFSDEQLWSYLLSGLSSLERSYCIVDALDEMDMQADHGFLDRLNRLSVFRTDAVKVLITSRPKQYLQRALPETSIVHISLERDLVGVDIARFVRSRLESCLTGPENTTYIGKACTAILERCDGLFLYARLLLDQLAPKLVAEPLIDVKNLISSLPVGLESMYNSMLRRQAKLPNVDEHIQQFLLEAVTHCTRPLRLNELSQALKCAFPDIRTSSLKDIARSACSPLLEILEDETVQVIHHSFTEFLLNKERRVVSQDGQSQDDLRFPVLEPTAAHRRISLVCLKYLRQSLTNLSPRARKLVETTTVRHKARRNQGLYHDDISNQQDDPMDFSYQEARLEFPFLDYATKQWAHHAAKYDVHDRVFFDAVKDFLEPGNEACLRWMRIEWATYKSKTHMPSILHIAAFAGLTHLAKTLDIKSLANAVDGEDRTPLHWACRRGCQSIVPLLLENGAIPLKEDCYGIQPMHEAAKRNYASIVELLLRAGARPDAPKSCEYPGMRRYKGGQRITKGETPLQYACHPGYTETISKMIPFLSQEQLQEALVRCCWHRRGDSVRYLLEESNASPNGTFRGGSPIEVATRALDTATVELLVEHGADVNANSEWKPPIMVNGASSWIKGETTALHELIKAWKPKNFDVCFTIFKCLVRAGADLNVLNSDGKTPLGVLLSSYPSSDSKLDRNVLRTLLDAGALFDDDLNDGILCRCVGLTDDVQAYQDLLDYGANLEHRGQQGSTVLHYALGADRQRRRPKDNPNKGLHEFSKHPSTTMEIVRFLMDRGAKLETRDYNGRSALEVAARSWSLDLDLFRRLFESCPDSVARQQCIWYLGYSDASVEDIRRYLVFLRDAGVSLEVRNATGSTPLLAHSHHQTVVDELVSLDANLNAVDENGNGVLHMFIYKIGFGGSQCLPRFRELVSKGLSIFAVNKNGNNLLHAMAPFWNGEEKQPEFLRYILDQGVRPDGRNSVGQSMLHMYLKRDRNTFGGGFQDHPLHNCVPGVRLRELIDISKEYGTDIDAKDDHGLTALHLAAGKDAVEFAYLLKEGADIDACDKSGNTVLHTASAAGNANVVGHVLDITGSRLINETNSNRCTALHGACSGGHLETVNILLRRGADPDAQDTKGRTPFHACSESRQDLPMPQILGMLLDSGANPKTVDIFHKTALEYAIAEERKSMVHYLNDRYKDIAELSNFRGNNFPIGSKIYETEKAKLVARTALLSRRETSLHDLPEIARSEILKNPQEYMDQIREQEVKYILSSEAGSLGEASSLVTSGFIQKVAESGRNDLMRCLKGTAKELDDRELVKEALSKRGTQSRWDLTVYNPVLASACDRADPNLIMLKILVEEHGLDPNAPKCAVLRYGMSPKEIIPGDTPLHVLAGAHSWWQIEALKYLVSKGADVNARDNFGRTPLHIASKELIDFNGYSRRAGNPYQCLWKFDCVKLLLDLGADPNALDNEKQTPLHNAVASPNSMRALIDRGANATAGANSPIFAALSQQNQQTLKILLDAGCDSNSVDEFQTVSVNYKYDRQKRYPLFCACFSSGLNQRIEDSLTLISTLLDHGADIYAILDGEDTLLHFIFQYAEYSVVKHLMDNPQHIDFKRRDSRGRTILHAACEWGECLPGYRHRHWEPKAQGIAARMVWSGFDVDLRALDDDGKSVLHHLLDNRGMEEDVILEVLKHPISKELVGLKDGQGYTAVQYALKSLRPNLVEALLDLGADLLAPDPQGATALHHIARQCFRVHKLRGDSADLLIAEAKDYGKKCLRIWHKFLAQGGNSESRDIKGNSPLLVFLGAPRMDLSNTDRYQEEEQHPDRCCHAENFEMYFDGPDIFARNFSGERALHIIAKRERNTYAQNASKDARHDTLLFKYLVKKGLDPLDEDGQGRTALDIATVHERKEILELYQYNS